jgi:hypothetical protein
MITQPKTYPNFTSQLFNLLFDKQTAPISAIETVSTHGIFEISLLTVVI